MYFDQQMESGGTGLLQMRKDEKKCRYILCPKKNNSKQNID